MWQWLLSALLALLCNTCAKKKRKHLTEKELLNTKNDDTHTVCAHHSCVIQSCTHTNTHTRTYSHIRCVRGALLRALAALLCNTRARSLPALRWSPHHHPPHWNFVAVLVLVLVLVLVVVLDFYLRPHWHLLSVIPEQLAIAQVQRASRANPQVTFSK